MRYFLDTEFDGFGGDLLSLALVRDDDGRSFYAVASAFANDEWVKANVVPLLYQVPTPLGDHGIQGWYSDRKERGFKFYMSIGEDIAEFLKGDPHPHIISDWPDDIRYLCAALITGPGEMVSIPAITFEVVRVDAYPTTLPGAVQHNAWWDAMALREKLKPAQSGDGGAPAYQVTAMMDGRRAQLVVSGEPDPYHTADRAQAERVLAEISALSPAYSDARIEVSAPQTGHATERPPSPRDGPKP